MNAGEQLDTSKLFKVDFSENLILQAPSKTCNNLEQEFIQNEKFFISAPSVKDEKNLEPQVKLQKQRELEAKHLEHSALRYNIIRGKLEENRNTVQRGINYILSPEGFKDSGKGAQLKSLALEISQAGLGERELIDVIDDLVTSKNTDVLGSLFTFYSSKVPKDSRQRAVFSEVKTKIRAYFSNTNLETLLKERHFLDVYLDLAHKRLKQIETMQKLPNLNMYIG
jgi:hypothetical protein